jgi:hypothetical protein
MVLFREQLTSDSKEKHFDDVTEVTAPSKQGQQSFCWSSSIEMRDDFAIRSPLRRPVRFRGFPYTSHRVDQPGDGPMTLATEVPV